MKKRKLRLKQLSKTQLLVLGLLGVLVCVEVAFVAFKPLTSQFLSQGPQRPVSNETLQSLATSVLKQCEKAAYKPTCFDEVIPKATQTLSMEDSFKVTKLVQDKDGSYAYCHVLGHELSARETAKDMSKWKDVITRCPSGMCSNGCIHGAFQERFRTEALADDQIEILKPDLKDVCEARDGFNPTGLEQASCYHAVGHLMMYITSADINKSISLCDEVAKQPNGRDFTHLCYDGAFMQIFQPLEPEDIALVKGKQPTKEQLVSYCAPYTGAVKGSCLSEGWPLFRQEIETPQGLMAFCNNITDPSENNRCYNAMFYVLTPQLFFDKDKISTFCGKLPKTIQGQCFANAASRMLETDANLIGRAGELCSAAVTYGQGDACYRELTQYSSYNFHAGSEHALRICHMMPQDWKAKCLAQNGS